MLEKFIIIGIAILIGLLEASAVIYDTYKSNKTNAYEKLRNKLPDFIIDAEKANFATGQAKKTHVMRLAATYLRSQHAKYDEKTKDLISNEVEKLLELPQKKEN